MGAAVGAGVAVGALLLAGAALFWFNEVHRHGGGQHGVQPLWLQPSETMVVTSNVAAVAVPMASASTTRAANGGAGLLPRLRLVIREPELAPPAHQVTGTAVTAGSNGQLLGVPAGARAACGARQAGSRSDAGPAPADSVRGPAWGDQSPEARAGAAGRNVFPPVLHYA
jgi:hypothetical protein